MISRVADHCFWFGRYLERAESTARLLQVTSSLALDTELTPLQCWQPVIITAGEQERFEQLHGTAAAADGEVVQRHLLFDDRVSVSLRRSLSAARDNARSIREVLSLEAWEIINELHLYLQSSAAEADYEDHPYGFYRRVRRETQLCLGLLRGTMLHDAPLYFCWLGVLLERVGQTARILDVHHHTFLDAAERGDGTHPVVEVSLWLSLLRACYGFEPFMKSHRGAVTGEAVARFLIFENRFPRAVRHGLRRARELLLAVRPPSAGPPTKALEKVEQLEEWLDERRHAPTEPAMVHELLTRVVDETHLVCNLVQTDVIAAAPLPAGLTQGQQQTQSQTQSQTSSNAGA